MELTLYIPALFGPDGRYSDAFIPTLPALETLLSRARRQDLPRLSCCRQTATLMGCRVPPGESVPVAALTRLVDAGGPRGGIWMRADPVHLATGHRGLVLVDGQRASMDQREALALAAAIRPLFLDLGIELEVPHPVRWYIRLPDRPALATRELGEVMGRDVQSALPTGIDAGKWLRLLNEIQMCMHGSDVNREREARGLPLINSVWFWGDGDEPEAPDCDWSIIHGNDVFMQGLAQCAGRACEPLPGGAMTLLDQVAGAGRVLVVHDGCAGAARYQDLQGWNEALQGLERDWFEPLLAALRARRLSALTLVTGELSASLSPWSLRLPWRRRRPFGSFIARRSAA